MVEAVGSMDEGDEAIVAAAAAAALLKKQQREVGGVLERMRLLRALRVARCNAEKEEF